MENQYEKVLLGPYAKIIYWSVILLLLIVILWSTYVWANPSENLEQKDQIYTAGATMRFAQELSSTNEMPYETGYNFELRKLVDSSKKN